MSLNTAIEQKYLPEVEALTALLFDFVNRWKTASTAEQRLLIESEAVTLFERLLDLDIELQDLKPGEHPEINEINQVYGDYTYMLRTNIAKLRAVAQMYLNHFNTTQFSLMELIGKLKRIRQKKAALSLWNTEGARFVLAEHFLNFDKIASDFQSLPQCDVDVNQGVLTLPVRSKTAVSVLSTRIGSASNGQPGNSDLDVTTNNINPVFAVNDEVDNWFEYERMDVGPCELTLILELPQEQTVNNIVIEPVNLGTSLPFEVVDIVFSRSNQSGTSIFDLVSGSFEKDFFTVKSVGNDNAWNVTFLPTQTKTIAVKLRAPQSYQIKTATNDDRVVLRERYAIAIKSINIFRTQFDVEGGINSLELPLTGNLYACVPFVDVWPPSPDLFDLTLEVSFDGGETWRASPELDDGIGSTVLMQGIETSMLWRLRMLRQDDSFSSIDSFLPYNSLVPETETLLRSVSRYQSPTNIPLPEKPRDNSVIAIQPRIARRGGKYSGIQLGEGTGTSVRFPIPFETPSKRLLEQIKIYANNVEYDLELNVGALGANQYSFSDDYTEILFSSALPVGAKVELVLDEELMLFEERSDGFYHDTELLFDPDKQNISVSYLIRDPSRKTQILPRDQQLISLNATNILNDTFVLTSQAGKTYTEVFTRDNVLVTLGGYYVDYVHGTIRFNANLDDDIVRATFDHQSEVSLNRADFNVVFQDNLPAGLRISKDAFVAIKETETMGEAPKKTIDVVSGEYKARTNSLTSATNARTLSHNTIVRGSVVVSDDLLDTSTKPEEVEFIDGQTEFLGLIEMLNEDTVEITASAGDSHVEFNLSAGALWYKDFDVVFSNTTTFSNKRDTAVQAQTGATGDYHLSDDGSVTVNVGSGGTLSSGIKLVYFYRDPNFDSVNKFSVDYENGSVYSITAFKNTAQITYKAANYKMGYDIAKQIDTISYDQNANTVSVRTEGLELGNSLVKLLWTKAPAQTDFKELKEFFSPLLSVLAFRYS